MEGSLRDRAGTAPGLAALISVMVGCSVGSGEGTARGAVTAPECDLSASPYDLQPTFFAAEEVEGQLRIRVQRGSDFEDKSDGLVVLLRDASDLHRNHLGEAIDLAEEASKPGGGAVAFTLYLNETCPVVRTDVPAVFQAVSGTITFEAVYAPAVSEGTRIEASFEDLVLYDVPFGADVGEEPGVPDRSATLEGDFGFFYSRGRPAQRFP
ncbi:MAG: hypothetical protein KC416_07410 [Myxococcales bacterium]|nr:hypothetical protein [Myxococcales bacterium]